MRFTFLRHAIAAFFVAICIQPAFAHDGVMVGDPYVRIVQGSGVAYFRIDNHSDHPDRLVAVSAEVGHAMLMTNEQDANGMMKMRDAPDGFAIEAGTSRLLQPAGDHVMLMHLDPAPAEGETMTLILTFERAGEVRLTLPVTNSRRTPPGQDATPFDATSEPQS